MCSHMIKGTFNTSLFLHPKRLCWYMSNIKKMEVIVSSTNPKGHLKGEKLCYKDSVYKKAVEKWCHLIDGFSLLDYVILQH